MITRRSALFGFFGLTVGSGYVMQQLVTASRSGTAFGTTVRLTVTMQSETLAQWALDAGFAELRNVHAAASLFDPKSEISRYNRDGSLESPSQTFLRLLRHSDAMWRQTEGAFDPSVQPLWQLWQMANAQNRLPTALERKEALTRVGWNGLNRKGLPDRTMNLTFNGIAQGYAGDCVIAAFKKCGVVSASADTGEFAIDQNAGEPLALAIRNPRNPEQTLGRIHTSSGFVATSGDYETRFTDDYTHHHIYDPRSGLSPPELASATVVAPTGVMADGMATACMVMGLEKSRACLARQPELGAVLVTKFGDVISLGNINYQI